MQRSFDVIVIGAGPVGEVLAGRLARRGQRVAIVERELVGGECSFWACMPSKALLRPSQALAEAARVPGAAQAIEGPLDVGAVLARRDQIINYLDDSNQTPWLADRGVTLIRGHGRLDGELTVRVGEERLLARRAVVLATGSAAAMPPIPGLREAHPWTNREATTASRIPASLVILGGGAVGVEMAQAHASLGSRVTLIEAEDRLLPREEPFAAEELARALREAGVKLRLGERAQAVARNAQGEVEVSLGEGGIVRGEELLVAVGRSPRTGDLGLDTVGLSPGAYVKVDEQLRVGGLPWLYAIGDVNGRALLTHMGKHQAHVLSLILAGHPAARLPETLPVSRVVFCEPQLAAVGLTLQEALDTGVRARAYDVASSATAGASFYGRGVPGTARIVVDERRGVLVGATFVGADVAEWLHAATVAIVGQVAVESMWDAVAAFPTRSEVWLKLLERREEALAADAGAA